jgi:two-component system phosphate regulon sensor histidine kinase PhoR
MKLPTPLAFLQGLTLTRRLILVIAVVVFFTALVANLIAYAIITDELETLVQRYARGEIDFSDTTALFDTERRLWMALLINTGLVAVIGASLSGLYMRRLVSPVWRLREAARRMADGDLSTPIQVDTHTYDTRILALALEQSRGSLAKTLDDLAETRDWLQALVQSIFEGIIRFDTNGQITFFSAGAAAITGWSPEEALHQRLDDVLPVAATQTKLISSHIPQPGERRLLVIRTRTRQECYISLTRARQINDGQTTLVLHDITEETNRRSIQAFFLAHMSHEFRTPLSSLRISLELLQENWRYLSFTEMDELLVSIHLSTTNLQNLIDNLLESSKAEANYLELSRRTLDINNVLSEALRVMQPLLNRRKQTLSLVEPLYLPPIDADPTRLVQVFVNLLSNASKYSPAATPIDLTLEHQPENRYIRVSIADRGPGIPEDQRERIFGQFIRLVPGASPEYSLQMSSEYGTGLGLSVVKSIIEGHGGQVGIEEHTGGGAVFWFTIPMVSNAG